MSDYRENSKRLTRIITRLRRTHLWFSQFVMLSQGEFMIMDEIVSGNSSGIKPSELSARLDMSKSVVSKFLAVLEERGLTCRALDPEDRRGILILPTPAGKREYAKTVCVIEEIGSRVFERMGDGEGEELLRLLEKFYGAFSEILSEERKMR